MNLDPELMAGLFSGIVQTVVGLLFSRSNAQFGVSISKTHK